MKMKISLFALTLATSIRMASLGFAADATTTSTSVSNILSQIQTTTSTNSDSKLKSLGDEFQAKIQALSASCGTNSASTNRIQGLLKGISSTNSAESFVSLQKLGDAKLTPEQTKVAKDVKDAGSAYLVQKNFGSIQGSSSNDVATIVTSLHDGHALAALPAIKNVSQNSKLTTDQKSLLGAVADKYAPGLGKAQEGLKTLKGFGL
jgi:hypothetical protein